MTATAIDSWTPQAGPAALGVSPTIRTTAHDRVYSDLRGRLVRGQFAPGTMIESLFDLVTSDDFFSQMRL